MSDARAMPEMNGRELYKELGRLTDKKDEWEANIPFVLSLLAYDSVKIRAKALWLLGEMGLAFPASIGDSVPTVAELCKSEEALLRERSVNALGRIGRGDFRLIGPYWEGLFRFASDAEPEVRLSFIWASENIAVNAPDPYVERMDVFSELLYDKDVRVRMEAPEMFRVMAKRRPESVEPYRELLRRISESDEDRVVRMHCLGALNALDKGSWLQV